MPGHDPVRFARDLSAKLASRSRHVCAFLGAGTSHACGLPDVGQLQTLMSERLSDAQKKLFAEQLQGRNLEAALSRIRSIASILGPNQELQGLTRETAHELDRAVCSAIANELRSDKADLKPMVRFAAWVARSQYHWPLEIFSVNYDLLLEQALETLHAPYFDGFVGTLKASFSAEMVEAVPDEPLWLPSRLARVWKLHGSVNWAWENHDVVRLGMQIDDGPAAIYPAETKYEESRRVPFMVLQDRFRRALQQPETLFLVSGYSFSDQHLNESFFDAATRHQRSEIVALCYEDEIPAAIADRALATPNLQAAAGKEAILGGLRQKWISPEEAPPDVWQGDRFGLADFGHLAAYLGRTSVADLPLDDRFRSLIEGEPKNPIPEGTDA